MDNQPTTRRLTVREHEFAQLRAAGSTQAEAYFRAYKPRNPGGRVRRFKEFGCKIEARPIVAAEIARLRSLSEGKKLLTLNERLGILAGIAQNSKNRPSDRTRAIDIYSRISGDQAPTRHEVSGPEGAPVPVSAAVTVSRIPIRDRIAAIRAAREAAAKEEATG